MKIDHRSTIPLHRQIEDQIRQLIRSGKYDKGELLPKEMDLARKFKVARNTVRQAINKLVIEGVLLRKKKVGTVLSPKTIPTDLNKWQSFSAEMNEKGVPLVVFLLKATEEAADETIANALGIRKGKKVIKMEKVLGTGKSPFVYFISWFHPRINFDAKENFTQPLYKLLEKKYGVSVKRSSEELNAVSCDRLIAQLLKAKEGEPLLLRRRTVFDDGNRIIEYNLGYYRGNKFSYKIDVNKD